MTTKQPDWEAIHSLYRAGLLSVRSIAEQHGISDTAIRKQAKKLGWSRDLTDNRDLFDQLGELMRDPDDNGFDKRNELYGKVISLPGRTKTMKEMAETLKTLISLERQAYDLDTKSGNSDADALSKLMDDLSKEA